MIIQQLDKTKHRPNYSVEGNTFVKLGTAVDFADSLIKSNQRDAVVIEIMHPFLELSSKEEKENTT